MTIAFIFCAAITSLSALISLGFSIASVAGTTGQTRTLAFYTVARSIAFAGICIASFINGSLDWLEACAVGMSIVQAGDAIVGVTIHDRMKTLGPAGTAIANLIALVWLLSQR